MTAGLWGGGGVHRLTGVGLGGAHPLHGELSGANRSGDFSLGQPNHHLPQGIQPRPSARRHPHHGHAQGVGQDGEVHLHPQPLGLIHEVDAHHHISCHLQHLEG